MTATLEEEIQSVRLPLDIGNILVSVMLQNQLFNVQEGSLVIDFLTGLHDRSPGVLGHDLGTVHALLVGDNDFEDKGLLQDGGGEGFLLDGDLDFDAFAVRFGPDEAGVDEANLAQTLQASQAQGHQFLRFQGTSEPLHRWLQVTITVTAALDGYLFRDSLGNVHLGTDTAHAHIC